MTANEKKRIAHAVGEYFLRVVKNHNYYLRFKNTFFKVNEMNHPRLLELSKNNVYMKAIAKHADVAEHEFSKHGRSNGDIYEYITVFINMVLHSYLESSGVDPRKLGMVGQELFDLACYGVFGDKYFEDMAKVQQDTGMRAPKNDKEAWAMAEYEARRRNGENLDFEEFMRQRTSMSDEDFWNRSPEAWNPLEGHDENNEDNWEDEAEFFDDDLVDEFDNDEEHPF